MSANSKGYAYNDFAVMGYVAWLSGAALSCVIPHILGQAALFAVVLMWFIFSRQSRDSWKCSMVYRVWAFTVIAVFGLMAVLKALPYEELNETVDTVGVVSFLADIVLIHILWWTRLSS